MDTVISKIRKNSSEDLWISLTHYAGKPRLDLRIYFRSIDVPTPHPTRKGIALDLMYVPKLIDTLRHFKSAERRDQTIDLQVSKTDPVHVYCAEFEGRHLVHIRTFYRGNDGGDLKPGKGIAFDVNLLSQVTEGIERAQKELLRAAHAQH